MNIDNLIKEIFKENGSLSKVDVSILIETIVKTYFQYKNISFEDNKNSKSIHFDLILHDNFEDFQAPCGLEIFIDLSSILSNEFLEKNNSNNHHSYQLKKIQSLILNLINSDEFS